MVQPTADYTHKWRKGDIVIWDNRCSYHKAAAITLRGRPHPLAVSIKEDA